jgi:hypothetical protein
MPKLQKSFELVITPEQFLQACSLLELQEVELLLDSHIRRAEEKELRKAYTEGEWSGDKFREEVRRPVPFDRETQTVLEGDHSLEIVPYHPVCDSCGSKDTFQMDNGNFSCESCGMTVFE